MNTRHTHRTSGFTLVELLTVIGIIGILASIVIAGVSGARERAREVGATSAMQSLALEAEVFYRVGRTYTGVCANTEIVKLRDSALNLGPCAGGADVCFRCNVNPAGTAYLYDVKYRTSANEYYCVDSARAAKRRTGTLVAAGVFTCP